jgi:DNA topoisomerase-3
MAYRKANQLCRADKTALERELKKLKVFNDKKVTDHHAIIPTGIQSNLQYNQQQVYDIITALYCGVLTIVVRIPR